MSNKQDLSQRLHSQLSQNSVPYRDPLALVAWDQVSLDDWWLPVELLSLHGISEFDALPEIQKKTLSQYEFIHTLNAGLWLEAVFMHRLSGEIRRSSCLRSQHIYHLHELREEAGHSLMFLELIQKSGLEYPGTTFQSTWLSNLIARLAPMDSVTFWSGVLIAEEISDRFNRELRKTSDICLPVRQVVQHHMVDEARHIAHARDLIRLKIAHMSANRKRMTEIVYKRLIREFVLRFYFPPAAVYSLAGLKSAKTWCRFAKQNPVRRDFIGKNIASVGKPIL